MTRDEISAKVIEIVAEQMQSRNSGEVLSEGSIYSGIGVDDLDEVELAMEFEAEFDIDIADEEMRECRTIGESVNLVERLMGGVK